MKKLLALTITVIAIAGILCGCIFGDGVSGENIKYYSKSENAVYVYSVCPECDHVGDIWEAKISSGEDASSMEVCDSCGHMFEIYVERN